VKHLQVGAHVSASGGLWKAVERAVAIEAEAIQVFPSAPQNWRATNHTPEAYARFIEARAGAGIGEVWMHSTYLVNLATESAEQLEKSIAAVVNALNVAHRAQAQGVVLHTGSHKGAGLDGCLGQIAGALERVFEQAEGGAVLALENAAGHGGTIGRDFGELGAILRAVDHPRLQVCVDTCHAYAGGHNLASVEGAEAMLAEFDRDIGLEHLVVWHVNDSKMGLGDQRDRHANIGEGHIGLEGFRNWLGVTMRVPEITASAMLLEVPGFGDDGPDLENVRRLRAIRDAVEAEG
jgi:deoxyribonuclease-4